MLLVIVGFTLATLVWIILRGRGRRLDDPAQAHRLSEAFRALADSSGLRVAIYDLGIVALVIGSAEVVLLLPGVPDGDSLASATAMVAQVVTRCRSLATAVP